MRLSPASGGRVSHHEGGGGGDGGYSGGGGYPSWWYSMWAFVAWVNSIPVGRGRVTVTVIDLDAEYEGD